MKQRDTHRSSPRRDEIKAHLISEHRHDPYKARGKLPEPSLCPECSAVSLDGRWQWTERPVEGARVEPCPACRRVKDRQPAGQITLTGAFLNTHGPELIRLARNAEALERSEHPLQRIMAIEDRLDRIVITTTDIHLPRRIGHALGKAYKGRLETHYDEAGHFVRMTWHRDD